MEFKTFADFKMNVNLIPFHIALDVMLRVSDWIRAGGNLDDDYVKRQLAYASEFANDKNSIEWL